MKIKGTFFVKTGISLFTFFALTFNACGQQALKNKEIEQNKNILSASIPISKIDTVTLGRGCYWCVEAVYEMLDGVIKVESGFSGKRVKNPSYREVCSGSTGHAEVVQITFNTAKTSLEEILKVLFTVHDPTTLNRQGADVGTKYRSVIFYRNDEQYKIAKDIVEAINKENIYETPIVTQVNSFTKFYKAEDYHQDYYNLNKEEPYCKMVIQPKIEKFEKLFKNRLKK